jgi:hypothetical protein
MLDVLIAKLVQSIGFNQKLLKVRAKLLKSKKVSFAS